MAIHLSEDRRPTFSPTFSVSMRAAVALIFLCSAAAGAETSGRENHLDFKAPPGADPAALEIFRKGLVALKESERVLGPVAGGSLLDEALARFSEARRLDAGPLLPLTHRYEIIAREWKARLEAEAAPPSIDKRTLELLRKRAGRSAPDHFDIARDLQAAGQYEEAARSYDAYISRLGSATTLIRWRYPLGSEVRGPSMKGTILFFKNRKTVHAVDTDTGKVIWTRSVKSYFTRAPIQEIGESLYVPTRSSLLVLDKATGITRADINYDKKSPGGVKYGCRYTFYVGAEERGVVAFCGPYHEGKGREWGAEVVYFDLAAGTSRVSHFEKAWPRFVGGRYGNSVWYTNALGRRGLTRADVTVIDLASGKETSLPDDAPLWKKTTPEIRAMTTEVYRSEEYFPDVINANGSVYHWKDKKTVEKRSKDGKLLWSYTSQDKGPKLIGISRAGPMITAHGGDLYCVNELRPARAGDPTKMQALLAKGICLSAAGKLAEAEESLRLVLKDKPYLARAHYELGWIRLRQGRPADALHTLDTAESLFQTELGWKKVCLSYLKEHGGLLAKVPGAGGGLGVGVNGNIVTEDYCYNAYEGAYSEWATGAFWQKKIRTGAVCIDGGKLYRTSLDARNLRDRNLEILDLKTGRQLARLELPGRCVVGTYIPHAKGPFRVNMKHIAERDGYVFCVDESAKGKPSIFRAVCTTDRTRDWKLVLPVMAPRGLNFTEPVGTVHQDRLLLLFRHKLMAIDLTEKKIVWKAQQSPGSLDVQGNILVRAGKEYFEYDPATGRLLQQSQFPFFGYALTSSKYYFHSVSNDGPTTLYRTRTGEKVWSIKNRGWYRHGFKYGRFRDEGLYMEAYGIVLFDPATGGIRDTWPFREMAFEYPTVVFLDDALVIIAQRAQRAFFYKFKDIGNLEAWRTGRRR